MNNKKLFVQWSGYQCEVQYDYNTNEIIEYLKLKKRLLGKGSVDISLHKTHLSCTDYSIQLMDSEKIKVEKKLNSIIMYGKWEEIGKTEMLDCLLLLCFERQMQLDGIVSVHASGVVFNGECFLFLGPREAGKTTVSYSICKELGAELACNDYIWLKEVDGKILAYNGDGRDELAFRSHALIQMDKQLFQTVYGDELEGKVNVRKKVLIKDLGISVNENMVPLKKIFFLGLGHTPKFECNIEDPIKSKVSLYENFCGIISGNEMILYDSNKRIGPFMPSLSCNDTHTNVHKIIQKLVCDKKVYNLRGPLDEIIKEIKDQFNFVD